MTTETTQASGTTQNTATDATPTTAAPAATEGTQQQPEQAAGTQGEQKPAEGAQGTGETTEGTKPAAPQGAPEKYEFKTPEGTLLDADVLGEFEGVAKELNLPQDAAQKVLDRMAPKLAAQQQAAAAKAKAEWTKQSETDKEFGGDKLAENLAVAEKALEQFGSPELKELLKGSGLSHHPEVIRLLHKVGRAMAEDGIVTGQPGGTGKTAQSFYAASQMNP